MTRTRTQSTWKQRSRRGFSLIEVLVVMVILLIGIFALARLFPGGFITIQRTGEMAEASSLSRELQNTIRDDISLPESIISAFFDASGNIVMNPAASPDTLIDYNPGDPLPTGLPTLTPYDVSNVNLIRYVIGEAFRAPVSGPTTGRGEGGVHLLTLGPVFNQFSTDPSGAPVDSVSVYGGAMERVEQVATVQAGQYDDSLTLHNENQYAADYQHQFFAFYPRAGNGTLSRQFRVAFDYYERDPVSGVVTMHSVVDGPGTIFTVPDDPNLPPSDPTQPMWVPMFNDAGNNWPNSLPLPPVPAGHIFLGIRRNSDDVSRRFRLVTGTTVEGDGTNVSTLWSNDPYEYAWYSKQFGSANMGTLIFNPRGRSTMITTSGGSEPLVVRVNYLIFDNHIIREKLTVPNQPPYTLKMSVPFIQTNGDTLPDQTMYNGIFRAAGTTPDVLIYNANTGDELVEISGGTATSPIGLGVVLDPQTGLLRFDTAAVETNGLQNTPIRVCYMAQKEWGEQVQKASKHYVVADSPVGLNFRSYFVGQGTAGNGLTSRIYFPVTEAGKTVAIGKVWLTGSATPVTGAAYRINDDPSVFETLTGYGPATWIDFGQPLDATQSGSAVENVAGGSLRARTIWRDVQQRWRVVDLDTYLTPPSAH